MTEAIVKSTNLPVTVKTRLGWDDDTKFVVDTAERLQDIGIEAISIHGRTRKQMYKGEADWTLIGEVKNNPRMKIPVFGNGVAWGCVYHIALSVIAAGAARPDLVFPMFARQREPPWC
jgi:tRNA-dihydrouridine synthase